MVRKLFTVFKHQICFFGSGRQTQTKELKPGQGKSQRADAFAVTYHEHLGRERVVYPLGFITPSRPLNEHAVYTNAVLGPSVILHFIRNIIGTLVSVVGRRWTMWFAGNFIAEAQLVNGNLVLARVILQNTRQKTYKMA